MSNDVERSPDPKLLEADLQRIKSETSRNEAERAKMELEAKEVEKRLKQKWYKGRFLFQAVVGGAVGAALVTTWGIGYFEPILRKELRLSELGVRQLNLENTIQKHLNDLKAEQIKRKTEAIAEENETVKDELKSLAAENEALQKRQAESTQLAKQLQAQLENISRQYAELSRKQQLTSAERSRFAALEKSAQSQVESLKGKIATLQAGRAGTVARLERIEKQLSTREIRGTLVRVYFTKKRAANAKKVMELLSSLGAKVDLQLERAIPKESMGHLWFSQDSQFEAAQQIKKVIAHIEPVEVVKTPFFFRNLVEHRFLNLWITS